MRNINDYAYYVVEQCNAGSMFENTTCGSCGPMKFETTIVGARDRQHFNMCCVDGKVKIPEIVTPPEALQILLCGSNRC